MKTFKKSFKIISLVLAFCMITSFLPVISFAEENTTAFEITVNEDGSTCTVTGFKADSLPTADGYELTIPETIAGYTVTAIGDNAFKCGSTPVVPYNAGVVTLPDTVKTIGTYAFYSNLGMELKKWPESLETIGASAFYNSKEGSISGDFSNTKLTAIGNTVFKFASDSLTSAAFPDTLTTIGTQAFEWTNITDFTFPDTLTSIGTESLRTCYKLKTVRFPRTSAITAIPAGTLHSAYPAKTNRLSGDMTLYIPETIKSIPSDLLRDFKDGSTVTIYGKYGSAAWQFANDVNEALKNSEYANGASYGSGTEDDPYTDADGDGLGELNEVIFISYNFDANTEIKTDDAGIIDGSGDFSITAGSGNESPASITKADGIYGKSKDDLAYKVDATVGHDGFNYKGGIDYSFDTTVMEISLALDDDPMPAAFTPKLYTSTAKDDSLAIGGKLISITNGKVSIAGSNLVAEAYRGKELCDIGTKKWASFAIVIPGYNDIGAASNCVYVYINGEKYEIPTSVPFYGTRHIRFSPSGTFDEAKTIYIDNFRAYTSETEYYSADKDTAPTVDFGDVEVKAGFINSASVTTAAAFKNAATADVIRIFEDDTYTTELSDSDLMSVGNVVVFATKNLRTTERAYSYYTVGEITYEEPGLYDGTVDLDISTGTGNTSPATVTTVGGIYGKAKDDLAYKVDATIGSSGYNFIGSNCKTLDTRTMEISFALPEENAPDLTVAGAVYTDTTKEEYTSGSFVNISSSGIYTGTCSLYSADIKGKKLCAIEPGQWINLAIVLPGYNQLGTAAGEYLVYINGTEYKLALEKSTYGTRHLRFAPDGTYPETRTVYYDNFRQYNGSSELYDALKDKQPVVDLSNIDVESGNINVASGTTVADFKELLSTKAAVRVFNADNYLTQLEDTDEMIKGNMVVFAASNSRTTERTYSYYTVNTPLSVSYVKLTNSDGKPIRGTLSDIERVGEDYYLETEITNKSTNTYIPLKAIAASYDESGKIFDFAELDITAAPGTTKIDTDNNAAIFKDVITPKGGTLKAFLWTASSNEPLCEEFTAEFNGKEEYHILAFSNSYGNDAFTYLPEVGKAGGVDIYAVNMYRGGCSFKLHYGYMNGDGTYPQRVEYTPDGTIRTYDVSFQDGLDTPGYTWDYITLQSRSVEAYNFDNYYTEDTPYLTELADYIKENSPRSELLMYETWTLDTDTAKTSEYTAEMVAGLSDEEIRPLLFSKLKANYIKAAEMIDNPNRIIPVGEAVNYALSSLGFAEWVKDDSGAYISSARGMYRDTTCHLSDPYGRVLCSLVWYEYLTGHDARENPYQHDGIPEEDMVLLKEAAHWACIQADYISAN